MARRRYKSNPSTAGWIALAAIGVVGYLAWDDFYGPTQQARVVWNNSYTSAMRQLSGAVVGTTWTDPVTGWTWVRGTNVYDLSTSSAQKPTSMFDSLLGPVMRVL